MTEFSEAYRESGMTEPNMDGCSGGVSHYICFHRRRIPSSWYHPDSTGWVPPKPSPREQKAREARYSRDYRLDRKQNLGHHMRNTWLAQHYYSWEWTTCGGTVLGPPLGEWAQKPKSKRMRQREARVLKKKNAGVKGNS